jgi:excisionase family DNA binding protein
MFVTEELLTVDELASIFKLTRWTIYNLTRQRNRREGALPYLKIGRELRFRRSAVESWLIAQERAA